MTPTYRASTGSSSYGESTASSAGRRQSPLSRQAPERDLDLTLRELGVTHLIAIGADTNICVLHTLGDAYFLGYDSIVVEDATRTFLCGTQKDALEHFRKCYGSEIVSTAELVAALT